MEITDIVIFLILGISIIIGISLFNKKFEKYIIYKIFPELTDELEKAENKNKILNQTLYENKYINEEQIFDIKKYFNQLILRINKIKKYIHDKNILEKINSLIELNSTLDEIFKSINENYYEKNIIKYSPLFENIEKYPLDILQQKTIITPEKYLLVVAGAGSGKTSTIVGKVKYLIDVEKIKPEEILLISFTSSSAKEMNSRIKEKLGLSLDVKTFHKLGLDIIRSEGEIKQSIIDDNRISEFKEYISKELIPEIILHSVELFMQFFHYLLKDNNITLNFQSIEDYKKYKDSSISELENISILGERMKSNEEVSIANFLFTNSIKYKYEHNYEFLTADKNFIQYKPDFFLPEYNIYIEHFGINRNGSVPEFFGDGTKESYKIENTKYNEGIKWKEDLHKKYNTKLIKTYSYENYENTLFENLKKSLINYNVKLKTISTDEIKKNISDKIKTESSVFNNLILTFLSLYKSNNLNIDELSEKQNLIFKTKYKKLKSEVFIKIFKLLIEKYENFLNKNNAIDFHDMINNATKLIQSGKIKTPYKYIIIDEFQDIGIGRYNLIKSILDKNDAKLFCVGDDWQSIYRFSGGDLNIFTQFEKYFQFGKKMFINKTYRYPQQVNKITHSFITKNKSQINKILESGNINTNKDVYKIIYYKNEYEKEEILKELKSLYSDIIGLGRIKSDGNICKNIMDFKTIHSAKGLEEDYVVILNGNSGTTGFPIEIKDSFLLDLVLSEKDEYNYSEERRLFYVALTRARKKTFILSQIGKKSIFVKELEEILNNIDTKTNNLINDSQINNYKIINSIGSSLNLICSKCGNKMILREASKGKNVGNKFYGCSNFPKCRNIVNI